MFSIWFFVYFKSGALKRPNWKHKWASKTSDWWREPKLWTVWRHRDCSQTQWTNLSCQHSNKNHDLGSIWWGKVRRGRKLIPQSEVREWEAFMWRLLITWLSMSLCHLWSISSTPPPPPPPLSAPPTSPITNRFYWSPLTATHSQSAVPAIIWGCYRSRRAGWRCSGCWWALQDSLCSRSSSSFHPRRTCEAPWPANISW